MEFEYKEEYSLPTSIILNVTDACNLACRYCFVQQNPHFMTYEIAQQAVYFALNNLQKKIDKGIEKSTKKAHITFFGGEPTIMWDEIIVPLTLWIKENNFPINLGMTTNGTLLTEERIDFLKQNEIIPLLSIDGDKPTQDYNRPCNGSTKSSFDLVEKNIPYLLKAFPNTTFRATIYSDTVDKTFDNYMFAIKMGFQHIFMMPDNRKKWTQEQIEELKQQTHYIFNYINFCFNCNMLPIGFSPMNKIFKRILKVDTSNEKTQFCRPVKRCGLGVTSVSIGYDGSIYGCQEQTSDNNQNNIFYIGNISNGIDLKLHKQLLKTYNDYRELNCEDENLCNFCPLRKDCLTFFCPSTNYSIFNDFFTISKIQCLWQQFLFNEVNIMSKNLVLNNNECFDYYLQKTCKFSKKKGVNKDGK